VYSIPDKNNHWAIKWIKNSKEGIVVPSGRGEESDTSHLNNPVCVIVDQWKTPYVPDWMMSSLSDVIISDVLARSIIRTFYY